MVFTTFLAIDLPTLIKGRCGGGGVIIERSKF